jgi:choline kinase
MNRTQSRCTTTAKTPATYDALTIIILAAGAGHRMKSRGAKALLPIGRATLLEHQITTLWKMYSKAEIIVVTGFQASKIRNLCRGTYPLRLVYNPQYETANVMFSIALALENTLARNVLILHGDILFNTNMIADLATGRSKIAVLPENAKTNTDNVGVVIGDNCITNMSYGLPRTWAQMAYFTDKELTLFEKIAFNHEVSSNWFFYEGINHVINAGGIFTAHTPANSHWLEINNINDLNSIQGTMI